MLSGLNGLSGDSGIFSAKASIPSIPFITGQTLGTIRNDFTAGLGFYFTVGASPITITALGRWVVAGNTQSHVLDLLDPSTNLIESVTLNTTGQTAGTYAYAALATPVVCTAGATYYVLSNEANGGDQWYSSDTVIVPTSDAAVVGFCFGAPGSLSLHPNGLFSYVPPNFLYHK